MRRPGFFAAALVGLLACRSAPVRAPAREAAGPKPKAAGPPPPLSQHGTVLAELDGTAVVALDLPPFAALPRDQRLAALALAAAAEQGAQAALDASYRHNLEIARLLRGILSRPAVVPAQLLARIRAFARSFWLNGGLHDAVTGRKVLPAFTLAELRTAALAAQAAGGDLGLHGTRLELDVRALEGPLFDPRVDALRVARPAGQDPLLASATNLYSGVGAAELERVTERSPLTTRLVREGGQVIERRVDLGRVAEVLEQAPQRPDLLLAFLRTPDEARFHAVERMWITAPGGLESAFGFFDTSADPRGRKGLFGALAGFADPAPPLGAPALPESRDGRSLPPASLSPLLLVATGGALRPLRGATITLGNDAPRRRVLVTAAAELAASAATGERVARELAPRDLRDDVGRCAGEVRVAREVLRELAGGTGPLATLGFDGPAAAEVRADAAADALATTAPAAALFSSPRCQELYPQIVASFWLAAAADAPDDGHLDAHHLRASRFEAFWFTSQGAVVDRRRDGARSFEANAARFRQAALALEQELDRLERAGDRARLSALFEAHAAQADLALRDELVERLRGLSRHVVVLPPRLEPVIENGRVVDARAVPIANLDDEVLRALQAL